MSNYEDDQSEDGELARSPVHQEEIDFSLSDEEMDTTDSLDIRPPQAKLIGQPLKDRSSRHGKSSRHKDSRRDKKHGYREREKLEGRGKKENDIVRVVEREPFHGSSKEHYRERERDRDREKEYIREKEVYRERDREHYREKEVVYRDKDVYREVDVYREKESYRYKEPYREKEVYRDKEVYRERDRRLDKESHRDIKEVGVIRDRERERERYIEAERNKDRKEKEMRERERDRSSGGDKELEDLRSRLLSKRKSKEQQQQEKKEEHTEARKAHLERRDKILQADRETSRRKEEGRAALEERRSRRSKRPPSPSASSPSPPSSSVPPTKKSRPSVSPPNVPEVVTLSDGSDHEQHEDGEPNSGSSSGSSTTGSDEDEDTGGSDDGGSVEGSEYEQEEAVVHRERERDRNINTREKERDRSRSASRSPVSERSDGSDGSPRDRRSRSRTRSRSRSRSHSFSPPRDANGDEIHHIGDEGEKVTEEKEGEDGNTPPHTVDPALPPYYPAIQGCRSVEEFQCLNRIEEGTYGVVYRAKDKTTEEIVALKRLKMEKEKEGFPITSLREINTLLKGQHPNIVTVREIVVGSNMDKIFIVMDYVEHDLKGLMETMRAKKQVFLPGEVKCLMQQLLKAVDHLHDNWILHRDLKTSNLLLSHKGILKVGDFGLAREYGSPLKNYTPIVVTLWYRAPELLLGARTYSTPIDIWSVGCIFAEFLMMQALFPGKSEVDQLNRIFKDLGTPNETVWPGWSQLSGSKAQWADHPGLGLRGRVGPSLSDSGLHLLQGLLTYDPTKRLQASTALNHNYFKELPQAIDPAMFPTWPAKSEGAKRIHSPKPPPGGDLYKQLLGDDVSGFHMGSSAPAPAAFLPPPTSFSLKF